MIIIEIIMEYLKFTDFRNHSKDREKGWKRNIEKIKIKSNKTTLDYILSERSEA
jgi:hypothetical protein